MNSLKAHKSSLTAVAVSPCGGYAFTASKDGGLVKWAVGEEGEAGAASVRRVGRVCAAGGHGAREEDVKGKGAKKAKSNKKKLNFGPRINAIAISSDGKFLVSIKNGEKSKTARILLGYCGFNSYCLRTKYFTLSKLHMDQHPTGIQPKFHKQ